MGQVIRPEDTAFDIGAHLGVHTVWLSRLVGAAGRVCAFEPNPAVLAPLHRTVERLDNVSLHPFALSDRSGRCDLFVPGDESMASLADWTNGEHGNIRKVSATSRCIDDLVEDQTIPQPNFIKCDVEGGELAVFRGARNTLNRPESPILMFEANVNASSGFGLTVQSAMDFLRSLKLPRYQFFQVRPGGKLVRVRRLKTAHCNILAVPHCCADRLPQSTLRLPRDSSD
ncbi:MAG: hypothetical protein A2V70_04570 [Planctomycetes bacterium RBG_13_63_9]|nr:MAG: hypothetical protein A2V70_04570 [Planctomycetes bacterium RBG_13_63_9]